MQTKIQDPTHQATPYHFDQLTIQSQNIFSNKNDFSKSFTRIQKAGLW